MIQIGKSLKRIFAIILILAVFLNTAPDIAFANEILSGTAEDKMQKKNTAERTVSGNDMAQMETVSENDVPKMEETVSGNDVSEMETETVSGNDILEMIPEMMPEMMPSMLSVFALEGNLTLQEFLDATAVIAPDAAASDGTSLTSLTLPTDTEKAGQILILLSNTDPAVYQNTTITITGNIDLTQTVSGMTFAGLGRTAAPFAGTLVANAGVTPKVTLKQPLFEVLSGDAENSGQEGGPVEWYLEYQYDETIGYRPLFAETMVPGAAGKETEWSFHVYHVGKIAGLFGTIGDADSSAGSDGSIRVNLTIRQTDSSPAEGFAVEPETGQAGLVCNTLYKGIRLIAGSVAADAEITEINVNAHDTWCAGGLVGYMDTDACVEVLEGVQLSPFVLKVTAETGSAGMVAGECAGGIIEITDLFSAASNMEVTAASGNAGLLVGRAAEAEIRLHNGWKIPTGGSYIISGKNAGELAGDAVNIKITPDEGKQVLVGSPVVLKATVAGGFLGGAIGRYELSETDSELFGAMLSGETYAVTGVNIDDADKGKTIYCGGIFGSLNVKNGAAVCISGMTITTGNLFRQNNYCSRLGGIAGRIYDDGSYADAATRALSKVAVKDVSVELKLIDDNQHCEWLGGLVGELGDNNNGNGIYLEVTTETAEQNKIYVPHAHAADNGFGGVVSKIRKNCVLNLENVAVSNKLAGNFWHGPDGAGLVAEVADGAAVRIGGTIDLSELYYWNNKDRGSATGQLVGIQGYSLIYGAEDLELHRGEFISGVWALDGAGNRRLSDIGNYGGVIRKSDVIYLDEKTHRVSVTPAASAEEAVQIDSVDDFIRLAITMQSHGYFSGVTGIDTSNSESLYTMTIALNDDIDLSGTGVYSLTRDTQEDEQKYKFTGSLEGNNYTLTLATGEKWGMYGGADCSTLDLEGLGQIYNTNTQGMMWHAHNRIGVFGEVWGPAAFTNINLKGTMEFGSNMSGDVYVGGLVAFADGRNGNLVFDNITNELSMTFGNEVFTDNTTDLSRVGGLLGVVDNVSKQLSISCYNSRIKMNYNKSNNCVKFGGVICEVMWCAGGNILIEDSILSSDIRYNMAENAPVTYAMAGGGLIGLIYGNDTGVLTLDGVQIKGQIIEANVAGGYAGGLLGYQWKGVSVVFAGGEIQGSGLKVEADGEQDNILKVSSTSGNKLPLGGLCYAASGYWRVEKNGIYLSDLDVENAYGTLGLILNKGYISEQGVYLELTDAESYRVDGATVQILKAENKEFDELVYDTTNNNLNQDRGGIISIATVNHERIDLPEGVRNTYINQTKFGGSTEWNTEDARSRYYYNLDKYRAETTMSGSLDSPEKVLLWSVFCYARDNIRKYFWSEASGTYTISGEIDLTGYSYYPIKVEGSVAILPGSSIVLNNKAIEDKEGVEAPSLRRSTGETSQHYRMHFGLLRELTGSLYVGTKDSADPVTLKGNVGGENNGSGFLVTSKFGEGTKEASKELSLYNVVLEDIYVNGYDGSSVRPLLINSVGSYVDVDIKTLYTQSAEGGQYEATNTNGSWYAASSLFGKVGSDNGQEIGLNFEDIRLDGRTVKGKKIEAYDTYRTIFSGAILLEAFAYADQSSYGTYNFIKKEDWNEDGNALHHVTYGREISESVRNEDLQWQYYGEPYAVDAMTADNNDTENQHRFVSGYLPYVKKGESGKNHEIDVNLMIYHLLDGCGTYGHPYSITLAGQLQTTSDFLNSGLAKKGWIVCCNETKAFCQGNPNQNYDKYYIYDGTAWKACDRSGEAEENGVPKTNEEMLSYLAAAYYSQDADMVMAKKFGGIGTEERPFHGVFVNGGEHTLTITTEGGSQMSGLVSVSDGCAVKDMKIHFAPKEWNLQINGGTENYFGGVIGKIVGGDSVVDGVEISYATYSMKEYGWIEDSWSEIIVDRSLTINQNEWGNGVKNMPVGGIVGIIEAGGVVFRNISGEKQKLRMTNDGGMSIGESQEDDRSFGSNYKFMFCNPYIGQLINGYAISQGCVMDNTGKNYPIAEFNVKETKEASVASGSYVQDNVYVYPVTISGADGLFAFSLIMSSGAASKNHVGYVEEYRGRGEAQYHMVGKAELTADSQEYLRSRKDDFIGSDENEAVSYIIRAYTEGEGHRWNKLNDKWLSVTVTEDCDMTEFGDSFRGIGYRNTNATQKYCGVMLAGPNALNGKKADGTAAKITYAFDTKEYNSDWMNRGKSTLWVGLFNCLYAADKAVLHDVQISGSILRDSYDENGTRKNDSVNENYTGGGLVGYLSAGNSVTLQNVLIGGTADSFTIGKAPEDGATPHGASFHAAGGAVGTCKGGTLILQDCAAENLNLTSGYRVGGFAGFVEGGFQVAYSQETTVSDVVLSTNFANDSMAGGLAGYVNVKERYGLSISETNTVTLQNLNVTRNAVGGNNSYVGGAIGYVSEDSWNPDGSMSVANIVVKNAYLGNGTGVKYQSNTKTFAGGIVGGVKTNGLSVKNCHFQSGEIVAGSSAGGLLGRLEIQTSQGHSHRAMEIADSSVAAEQGNTAYLWGYETTGGAVSQIAGQDKTVNISSFYLGTDGGGYLGYAKSDSAGGVIGCQNNQTADMKDVRVENMTLAAPHAVGGLEGYADEKASKLLMTDISVKNSRLVNTNELTDGGTAAAGGLFGGDNGTCKYLWGSNILLEGNRFYHFADDTSGEDWKTWLNADLSGRTKPAGTNGTLAIGHLFGGLYSPEAEKNVKLVGVTVQDSKLQGEDKPLQDSGYGAYSGYIVWADYLGSCSDREKDSVPGVYPFVNTSPYDESFLKVYSTVEDAVGTQTYGDGVAVVQRDGQLKSVAQIIYEEGPNADLKAELLENRLTLYNEAENQSGTDFPVLLMEEKKQANVDSLIKSCMDLLTNGGASAYAKVTDYRVAVRTYQKSGEKFVEVSEPSMTYTGNRFYVVPGKNDSGYQQFTLIEVTFKDPLKSNFGEGNDYVLYLPVLVKLPVEITFYADVLHDTVFLDADFDKASTQVLAEYGSRATARFSYSYEYNWGTVLMALDGKENTALDNAFRKNIQLYDGAAASGTERMPWGTRLTLIDARNEDLSYSVTLQSGGADGVGTDTLDFANLFEASGWNSKTLKDILRMEKAEGTVSEQEELWAKVPEEELPDDDAERKKLLYFGEEYYRTATDTDAEKYKLVCEETYYLVMEFPEGGTSICNMKFIAPEFLKGQYTGKPVMSNQVTNVRTGEENVLNLYEAIAHKVTKTGESLSRYINDMEQTPQIITGGYIALDATKNKITLQMKDEIQAKPEYVNLLGEGDKRFLQFSIMLDEYTYANGSSTKEDSELKAVVLVEAKFYHADEDNLIASYEVVVPADTRELILPVATRQNGEFVALNLVDYLKKAGGSTDILTEVSMTFYPDSSMAAFPVARVNEDGIPSKYGQFDVSALLSEKADFLTGARESLTGAEVGYYRESSAYAKLYFEADELSELGINIKSPDEAKQEESAISAAGYIDAAGIQEVLEEDPDMVCTLKLYQKQDDGTYSEVPMSDYLTRASLNGEETVLDAGAVQSLTWTVPAGGGSYAGCYTAEKENFVIPAEIAVKHNVAEDAVYANYRVELTVEFEKNGETILALNPDYFIYTFAKISTDLLQ